MSSSLGLKWKIGWVVLIVVSVLVSTRMAYMAPVVLAASYPIAQMISISLIPGSRYSALWLLHVFYWLIVLYLGMSEKVLFIGMLGSSILGEMLIRVIIPRLVKWRWLVFNTLAMIVLIASDILVSYFDDSLRCNPIVILVSMFTVSALVSAQGIKQKTQP